MKCQENSVKISELEEKLRQGENLLNETTKVQNQQIRMYDDK